MRVYKVMRNDEAWYSIWPEHHENPKGWFDTGTRGALTDCMRAMKRAWLADPQRRRLPDAGAGTGDSYTGRDSGRGVDGDVKRADDPAV
jgi:uncharacterized protein YbdZ (MbtH family)